MRLSDEKKAIKTLRKKIPGFKCKPGCYDCCGPIPFTRWEWKQVKDKRKATSLTCPYASDKGCAIYEDRPIMCRLYGTVKGLECPHGCAPEKMLSPEKEHRIIDKYVEIMRTAR